MPEWFRTIFKLAIVTFGLFVIYLGLQGVISATLDDIQKSRDDSAGAVISSSYMSETPFGKKSLIFKRGTQVFFNMIIARRHRTSCFVRTSWRWVLHLPTGNNVMWSSADGEFVTSDKPESISQAVQVPAELIKGEYTLSRLAVFKCGDDENYAKVVINTDLLVE